MNTKIKYKRNPLYPYIGLETAEQLIRKLYKASAFYEVPANHALEVMGYSADSSSGDRVLSALLKYGLLEDKGSANQKSVWLSELAKTIILTDNNDARLDALRTAALNDDTLKAGIQRWSDGLPASDKAIISTLMMSMGFKTPRGATRYASVLRESYKHAQFGGQISPEVDDVQDPGDGQAEEHEGTQKYKAIVKTPEGYTDYPLRSESGQTGLLRIPNEISEKDYKFILSMIEVIKQVHVKAAPTDF